MAPIATPPTFLIQNNLRDHVYRITGTQGWNCQEVGGWGVNPPVHVYRRSFLSENRFKISIPGQKFKHFDIWPTVLLGQFQHCRYQSLSCWQIKQFPF